MVRVELGGEVVSEPWVMHGGVPKHDVAHCYKPDGLDKGGAQSKSHQEAHTLACLKRHAKKTQAAAAAAEVAAAKELSTSLAKAAMAAAAQAKEQEGAKEAEERQQKRARDKAAGKPLDMSAATQTGMGAFFAKRPKPAARSSPDTAAAAGPCTPAPAGSPPPTTAGPSPTAAATRSPPTAAGPPPSPSTGKSPAPSSKPTDVEQTGDAFDSKLKQHFEKFEVTPPPEGLSPDAIALFLAAAVNTHVGLLRRCPGFTIDVGLPTVACYPFAYHATQQLPWTVPNAQGVVFADGLSPCSSLVVLAPGEEEAAPCSACAELPSLTKLKVLQKWAKDPNRACSHAADAKLSHMQMCKRRDLADKGREKARLATCNPARDAKVVLKFREGTQRVFQLIADNKMPRLHQLFKQALARGATPQKLQELLGRCASGEYRPKGYDQDDLDSLLLVQRIGGGRLTYALNKTHGLPSPRMLYSGGKLPRFLVCPAELEYQIVFQNMETFIFSQPCNGRSLWTLMADNVAVEERWRYAQHRNCFYGGCREHTPGGKPLFFNRAQDALDLKELVTSGKIHLAKEALFAALAPNAKHAYFCRPVAAQGSCKKDESWEQHGDVLEVRRCPTAHPARGSLPLLRTLLTLPCHAALQKIEKIWYTDARGYALRGPISNASTDGAGIFRQAAVDRYQRNLMSSAEGSMESKVLKVLKECLLFDLWSGKHGITDDTDAKHDAKCLRGCCKSATRGLQVVNHTFYGSDFRRILRALGHSEKDVATMLDPEDEQNVPAMLQFFTALAKLTDVSAETLSAHGLGLTATLVLKACELQLLGAVAQAYVFLLTGFNKSISEHLVNLAEMQATIFVLQRRSGTKFLPNQNYTNTSTMIRAKFKSVALAQAEGISEYYIFQDCDDALEGFFGVLRTLSGNQRNFDLLQVEEKATHAMQIAEVYLRHPDWDRGSRRLSGSLDHWNTKSWTGCTDTSKVNVAQAWMSGLARARARLVGTGLFTPAELDFAALAASGKDISMLKPNGERIGAQLPARA